MSVAPTDTTCGTPVSAAAVRRSGPAERTPPTRNKCNLAGIANEENPLVYLDLSTGQYFHFVANNEPAIGHLNSLVATTDAIFAADLASGGSLSTPGTGVIYQIRVNPLPVPALSPVAVSILVVLLLVLAATRSAAVSR